MILIGAIVKNSLLKETGRISENPIFIVGMYSGVDKIGEGYGSSLKMAETRVLISQCIELLVLCRF